MSSSNEDSSLFPESITLGLIKTLEESPGVSGVELSRQPPSERAALSTWEQRHSCSLPTDLRNFYLATDGFKLIWNYVYIGEVLPIGNMRINSINELKRIGGVKSREETECPTPLDIELCLQQVVQKPAAHGYPVPNFGPKCKIFELDPCQGLGKVCLVYQPSGGPAAKPSAEESGGVPEPNIWLLDRCSQWHFLAAQFSTYFRMMLVHRGLPQWQFRFTPLGLTPWAEQMFAMVAPGLLQPEQNTDRNWDREENLLDPAIFKLKTKGSRSHSPP